MVRESDDRDPAWFTPKVLLWALLPGIGLHRARRGHATTALQQLRLLFTAFGVALALIGLVVVFLSSGDSAGDHAPTAPVAAAVVGFGLVSLLVPRLVDRPLDCSTAAALVGGYQTRFFLRIAFADSAALVGFVGFFLTDEPWMYPIGLAFAAVGFVRLAPSNANLARDQDRLNVSGCGTDLKTALTGG